MAILSMTTCTTGLCCTLLPEEQRCLPTSAIKGTARQNTTRGQGSAACSVEVEARLCPVLRAEAHEMIDSPGCPLEAANLCWKEHPDWHCDTRTHRGRCGNCMAPENISEAHWLLPQVLLRPLPRSKGLEFLGMQPERMHLTFFFCSWILTTIESELKKNGVCQESGCCGLNFCVPPKCICWNPNP